MPAINTLSPQAMQAMNSGNATLQAGKSGTAEELRSNFMTMLVTQLRNQDPLNPLENSELTSHLAQINTVSGIDSLNDTLDGITSQIDTGQSLQAAALIGRGVLVPGDRMLVGDEGVATPFGVELAEAAEDVRAHIVGSDGQVLHSMQLGPMGTGTQTLDWNGELGNGEVAPPGAYRIRIEAVGSDGEAIEAATLNYAVVSGVSSTKSGARLDLGGISEPVGLDEVRQIL